MLQLRNHSRRFCSQPVAPWRSSDPIGESGGLNEYCFVGNNPRKYIDPDGRAPKNVSCGGKCGATIDDWIRDEINAQKAGWDNWKKEHPKAAIGDYLKWANGNQRYKDPNIGSSGIGGEFLNGANASHARERADNNGIRPQRTRAEAQTARLCSFYLAFRGLGLDRMHMMLIMNLLRCDGIGRQCSGPF